MHATDLRNEISVTPWNLAEKDISFPTLAVEYRYRNYQKSAVGFILKFTFVCGATGRPWRQWRVFFSKSRRRLVYTTTVSPCRLRMFPSVLRIRIRIRIAPWIRIRIPLSSSKNSKKNFDFYCFATFFDFLFLKNDINLPSKSNKQKNFSIYLVFFWRLESQWRIENSRIRIHSSEASIRGSRSGSTTQFNGSATLVSISPSPLLGEW